MGNEVTIVLTSRERELILQYGYPFDNIKRQLRKSSRSRRPVKISDGPYWWEQVVGNLSISVNEDVEDRDLAQELCDLADAVEWNLELHKRRTGGR